MNKPGSHLPIAVALHYRNEGTPRVVAKGGGEVAASITAVAREHGIPIQHDAELASALVKLDLNTEIPRELYVAVAEVLRFVWGIGSAE